MHAVANRSYKDRNIEVEKLIDSIGMRLESMVMGASAMAGLQLDG
jgi:hypothetical protein